MNYISTLGDSDLALEAEFARLAALLWNSGRLKKVTSWTAP